MKHIETNSSSPVFHLVTILVATFSLIFSFSLFMQRFAVWEALLIALGLFFGTFIILYAASKHPSGMGASVDVSHNAPVQWKLLFLISGVFTILFSVIGYYTI